MLSLSKGFLPIFFCMIFLTQACVRFGSTKKAVANFNGEKIKGNAIFTQEGGKVKITGELEGLDPNSKHGFHVHEFGDVRDNCLAAGGHYNPFTKKHGSETSGERHVGDLGNIEADGDGKIKLDITVDGEIDGRTNFLGRAVVIHEKIDDLGQGGDSGSEATGNSGKRIACSVVGSMKED